MLYRLSVRKKHEFILNFGLINFALIVDKFSDALLFVRRSTSPPAEPLRSTSIALVPLNCVGCSARIVELKRDKKIKLNLMKVCICDAAKNDFGFPASGKLRNQRERERERRRPKERTTMLMEEK